MMTLQETIDKLETIGKMIQSLIDTIEKENPHINELTCKCFTLTPKVKLTDLIQGQYFWHWPTKTRNNPDDDSDYDVEWY